MPKKPASKVTALRPTKARVLSTAPADEKHIPFIDLQAQRLRLGYRIETAMERVLNHGPKDAGHAMWSPAHQAPRHYRLG
jgi:hypothetical protein